MKIDLNCPVEIWACKRPEADYPACELTLFNLSDQNIVSVEVTILLEDQDGMELSRLIDRNRDLFGQPGQTFHMPVAIPEDMLDTPVFRPVLGKVWFEDGTVWRHTSGQLTEYRSNALPQSRALSELRAVAGENLVAGFPEEQGDLWLCVCGRPNLNRDTVCRRCGRDRQAVFASYSQEAVRQALSARQAALEAQTRQTLQAAVTEAEPAPIKRRKKRRWIAPLVIALVLLAGAAWAGYFHLLPYLRYRQANTLLEQGDYAAAEAAFTAMDGYRDAGSLACEARYRAAGQLLQDGMENKDTDSLSRAREAFIAMGSYADSASRAQEADYQRAMVLLGNGQSGTARAVFEALGTYADSQSMVTRCAYEQATELLESGRWSEASAAFAAIVPYSDSAEKASLAMYRAGQSAYADGDLDAAIAAYTAAEGYQDSAEQIQRCHYEKGSALFEAGDTAAAGQEFLLAGSYENAAEQAIRCIYTPALAAMNAGRYTEAAALFASIPDYADATERWRSCILADARRALHDLEFIRAREVLTPLPAEDEEAAALRNEIDYRSALAALSRQDYETAIRGLALLGDYSDSADQLNKARYAWARSLESAGQTAEALALYEQLGSYGDSASRLKDGRWAQAEAAVQAEDWAEAVRLYTELGDWKQSKARLREARQAQAAALFDQGDYIGARAIYAALGDSSAGEVQACDYALAGALADAGDLTSAISAYEALGDYSDAAEKALSLRYQQAMTLADSDPQAAIDALDALGDWGEAAESANALRYRQAMALAESDPQAALAALDALGDWGEAAESASALRYQAAKELLVAGKLTEALQGFEALGAYSDAAQQAMRCRYALAEALVETEPEAAVEAFLRLGDYSNAASRAASLLVGLGQQAEAAGLAAEALSYYRRAGEAGAALAEAVEDAAFAEAAEKARKAAEAEDSAGCALALDGLKLTELPERYADLKALYDTACETEARRLLALDKPELAYPYLQRLTDSPWAAEQLNRTEWRILGQWDGGGHSLRFDPDGTGALDGEPLTWQLEGINVISGGDTLLKLVSVDVRHLVVRDVRGGSAVSAWYLSRTADAPLLPLPDPAKQPAQEADLQPPA